MSRTIQLKLAWLRKRQGITQQELANHIGFSFQTISKWENGVTMPDVTVLPVLADYFQVSVDELLGLKPVPGGEYIPAPNSTKEFWDKRLEYLLCTRKGFWNVDYMEFLIRTVWKLDRPVDVLDCGCGYGFLGMLLLPLLPEGSTYTGIDFSEELLSYGKELYRRAGLKGRLEQADVYQVSVDRRYDVVICQAVLRHTDQPELFMEKMIEYGKTGALIACVDVNREFESDGLYIDGMDYGVLCEHEGLKKLWQTEIRNQGRDYAVAMRIAHMMRKRGLKDIDIRMNDRVSLVTPDKEDYQQSVEDFLEANQWNREKTEEEKESEIGCLMNRGMNRKEAEEYCRRNQRITEYFAQNPGQVSYTHVLGLLITYGRKQGRECS